MSSSNNDGELAKLLELKRSYKVECEELEAEIETRLRLEQEERKKELTSVYVEELAKAIAERIKPLLWEVLKN